MLAIRRGPFKLICGKGSGGWTAGGDDQPAQLYNLDADPGETTNLLSTRPQLASELADMLGRIVRDGRSTPGSPQANDRPLNWHISTRTAD